ncbi:hypothetical protein P8605_15425 [Streptomyces sp. T-3]|nr:hypothetical protein [Streptomyces sp. T-3]
MDFAGHLTTSYDPNVYRLVQNALDPAHAEKLSCKTVLPLFA